MSWTIFASGKASEIIEQLTDKLDSEQYSEQVIQQIEAAIDATTPLIQQVDISQEDPVVNVNLAGHVRQNDGDYCSLVANVMVGPLSPQEPQPESLSEETRAAVSAATRENVGRVADGQKFPEMSSQEQQPQQ